MVEHYALTKRALRLCVWTYKKVKSANQTARLLRDTIDFFLRRYHNYCIKEKIGAHYVEVGLKHTDKKEFEHVMPASLARDLIIHNVLTIDEALHIPTCILSKKNHAILNSTNLGSTTPDIYWFWQRYKSLNINIKTHDGTIVDVNTWNLQTHYNYFKQGNANGN